MRFAGTSPPSWPRRRSNGRSGTAVSRNVNGAGGEKASGRRAGVSTILRYGRWVATAAALAGLACSFTRRYPDTTKRPGGYREVGAASYYGREFHGRATASGEKFDMNALTAAHKTLPFGTRVRVTNLANDKSVVVRVNDRGPFVEGRIIDLSYAAAKKIGMVEAGVVRVEIVVVK
ncbi:MAG: septal ring lytic transglycosylase RlpA family protein [Candidatus Coatesbacteria bacterium]|nr:MAG: septal ring lytic transglycosylase RlpA family protein [Candidatus Coatesbacteria bacterium]